MSSKRLEDILKMSWRRFWKASWRRLEDVSPSLINWSWQRRLEDVLKTSPEDVKLRRTYSSWSRRLQDVFIKSNVCWGRRLQHLFSVTSLRLKDVLENKKLLRWRRPADVLMTCLEGVLKARLKRSWRNVLKMSWGHVLKTSWRHALKTSWRNYGYKQNTYWGLTNLTNLNVYLTNLYFTNLHLTILRRIQNALIRTQWFHYSSYFGTEAASLF